MSTSTMTARNPITEARFSFQTAREHLNTGEQAVVNCSHQCSVMLMDDENLKYFIDGHKFHYYGGFYKQFPVQITAPQSGHWNVVLHMGGIPTAIKFSFGFKRRPSAAA